MMSRYSYTQTRNRPWVPVMKHVTNRAGMTSAKGLLQSHRVNPPFS